MFTLAHTCRRFPRSKERIYVCIWLYTYIYTHLYMYIHVRYTHAGVFSSPNNVCIYIYTHTYI